MSTDARSVAINKAGPVHVSTSRNTVPAATHNVALPPALLLQSLLLLPPPLLLPLLLLAVSLLTSALALRLLCCMPPPPAVLLPRPGSLVPLLLAALPPRPGSLFSLLLAALPRPPPLPTCHFRSIEYSSGALTQRMCISGASTCQKSATVFLEGKLV